MRPAAERKRDFDDIYLPYGDAQASWEAARCLACHDAPCSAACEAGVDVRRVIRLAHFGDPVGAAEAIRRSNVLGATCSRVCDAEAHCLAACTRGRIDRPIDIPGIEGWALAIERRRGARPLPVGADRGRSVAVVGGGPAGLAATAELRRLGHRVALFDAAPALGGLLARGIPPYRLPRAIVLAELADVVATGVEFHLGHRVASVEELLRPGAFDAVIVAVGLGEAARLGVDGEDLGGVFRVARVLDGTARDVGLRPVVIGGGTSALDAATTALRLAGPGGRVAILYRRGEQQMPAFAHLREIGREEGVLLRPLTVVERILGDRDGRVAAVRCRSVDLGPVDSSGRPGPLELSGGTFDLQVTSVVVAAGDGVAPAVLEKLKLTEAEPRGDENGRTRVERLYVAGDVVGGARSVAWAVGSGVRAARAVEADLRSGTERTRVFPVLGKDVADLAVEWLGRRLPNPFLLAASPATDSLDATRAALHAGWAGVVVRTTSVEGTPGAAVYPSMVSCGRGPRGLAALGHIERIAERHIDAAEVMIRTLKEEHPESFVAASIAGDTRQAWQRLARQAAQAGADAVECNLLLPQGGLGAAPGAAPGPDATAVRTVARWVKDAVPDVPVVVKLLPHAADLPRCAKAVAEGGGQGITAADAVAGLAGIDVERREPLPAVGGKSRFGGVSGPAILPFSCRAIAKAAAASGLPVAGCGGVESWRDAAAMILAGATVVQVAAGAMIHGHDLIDPLTTGLAHWLERQGAAHLADLVGGALGGIVDTGDLVQPGPVRARVDLETCVRCGRCHVSCRDGATTAIAWDAATRALTVSLERCTGCGLCAAVCPVGAISLLTLAK
jgi:NADPH-dependent glutamate synthase beta subunit-like oxidoreductase/dihydroorotate dehydrogenase/Pyruvate/2-oxoacid:ferredoxin oxidoreductase delta subunit